MFILLPVPDSTHPMLIDFDLSRQRYFVFAIASSVVASAFYLSFQMASASVEATRIVSTTNGGSLRLFSAAQPTAVLIVTAECAKCRIGTVAYRDLWRIAEAEGFAFRAVVASGPVAARQFAFLLPNADEVALDADSSILHGLRVSVVPSVVLVSVAHTRTRVLPLEVPRADTVLIRRELREFQRSTSPAAKRRVHGS